MNSKLVLILSLITFQHTCMSRILTIAPTQSYVRYERQLCIGNCRKYSGRGGGGCYHVWKAMFDTKRSELFFLTVLFGRILFQNETKKSNLTQFLVFVIVHSFETQWKSRHLPCSNGVRFFFQEIDGNKDGNIQDSEIVYFFNLFDANGIVFPMQLYLYVSEENHLN